MRIGSVCRLLGVLAAAVFVLATFPVDASASTSSGASGAARAQRSCDDYIPTDLAINVPSATPGQTVIISGLAYPGDTVTIRIATLGGPPIVLGTAVAGDDGRFSASVIIPADFVEGSYNITVSSPQCDGVSTITLVVRFPGGRCLDRRTVEAERGDTIDWTPLGRLDTTKPLTITLVPIDGGSSVVVFSGAHPGSSSVSFVVPASLSNGRYRIVESGTGIAGGPVSARCGRLVVQGGGGGGTTTTTSTTTPNGSTTTTTTPGTTCESYSFDPTVKLIDFDGYNAKVEFSPTVTAPLGAGSWNITNASSWDSYPARTGVFQGSEVWEVQFLDAADNVLAHSGPTGDVPDYVDPGQWSGPLGTVTLPAGVVKVRAHHLPDLYPDGPDSVANSVFPVGFSICGGGGSATVPPTTSAPTTTSTTVPGSTTTSTSSTTSTTSTTIAGGGGGGSTTTTTSTTAPPSTTSTSTPGGNVVASTTTTTTTTTTPAAVADNSISRIGSNSPTQVAGNSTSRSSGSSGSGVSGLATTGSTIRPFIALAVIMIATGALFALGSRRRKGH